MNRWRPLPRWYVALLGLEGAQRLREMAVSNRHERELAGPTAAGGRYPLMVALHIALFCLPPLEVIAWRRRPRLPLLWVAGVGAASTLRWWSIRSLGSAWNARAVVPTDLRPVTSGPYRWVRHPNYVAVALEFLCLPLAAGAWLSAIGLSLVNAALLADRIRAEERLLRRIPGYAEAFAGRARFLPGLF
ncbi:isoprenylcysteine carboxylmethyltransferase family protein [Candidatus Dormiibacter inghamiae]|uniref:isoprenylcysteine carboxylmethyltransferase family protein n=1 Tax=Candidatus Dormiibacter inghamiae TaxID=3127013 RepID=UPI0030C74C66